MYSLLDKETNTKKCSKCQHILPIIEFGKNRCKKDGFATECRQCQKFYYDRYKKNNKEKIKLYKREHYLKNKKEINTKSNLYLKQKRKRDLVYRVRHNILVSLNKQLNSINSNDKRSSLSIIGATKKEFDNHFLKYLNLPCEDCKNITLTISNSQIDHIIPSSIAIDERELKFLNQLENLRLICPDCNNKKRNKLPDEWFKEIENK